MSESIFTNQVPALTNLTDGPYELLTVFTTDAAGTVTAGRWYFPNPLPSNTVTWHLWDDSGTSLASRTFTSPTAGAWNVTSDLPSPVSLSPSTYYGVSVFTPDNYVATSAFFLTSGITNGSHLSSPQTNTVGGRYNGRFLITGNPAYPPNDSSHTFNGGCYFADLVFTPSGSSVTGTAAASLGGLTATAAGVHGAVGSASAALGGLSVVAAGIRTAAGTAGAVMGALGAAATGTKTGFGTVSAALGMLAGAEGHKDGSGVAGAVLGGLGVTARQGADAITPVGSSAGWDTLLNIMGRAGEGRELDRIRDTVICPNDGTMLQQGPDGLPFCSFDGWRPN